MYSNNIMKCRSMPGARLVKIHFLKGQDEGPTFWGFPLESVTFRCRY